MRLTRLFRDFFESEKAGGLLLILCTLLSLALANSAVGGIYHKFFQIQFQEHSLEHWINDGLMTIFFLLIGLELEREIYIGELSNPREAMLPIVGALGGMLVPAGIYLLFNFNGPAASGAGIPMATDIAFALGALSLLGNRVPLSMKVFLTALAVIDDLGAILVIALFYTKSLMWSNLLISLGIFGGLLLMNRMKVRNVFFYLIPGIAMWYFMLHSGVHATITGVLLAFAIPFGNGDEKSCSFVLQNYLHSPVAFIILPLFALANTAIHLNGDLSSVLLSSPGLGIAGGLLLGKPLGIFLFCFLAIRLGWCKLPADLNYKNLFGVCILAGIGFTMSIFITLLAFDDETLINSAKLVILIASFAAGIIGYFYLSRSLSKKNNSEVLVEEEI